VGGTASARRPSVSGSRIFSGLGHAIVRHPWYPIIFWVLLLVVAIPAVLQVNSVTTNSATTLPNSAPSVSLRTRPTDSSRARSEAQAPSYF